jgi:hypothetical protein
MFLRYATTVSVTSVGDDELGGNRLLPANSAYDHRIDNAAFIPPQTGASNAPHSSRAANDRRSRGVSLPMASGWISQNFLHPANELLRHC